MAKRKLKHEEIPPELTISSKLQDKVEELINSTHKDVSVFWDEKLTQTIFVPVDDGAIRVFHVKPEKAKNKRILLFFSGWGVLRHGFNDLYEALYDEIEFYYIETREKGSSILNRKKAKMTVEQSAKDIQDVINYLGINKDDFVLMGPCWASLIMTIGLKEKLLDAPTIVLFDPAEKLWFPRFIIEISIIIPSFILSLFKPMIKFFVLLGMKEKTQRKRTNEFIKNAIVWKWKKAAYNARRISLFKIINNIDKEIFVFNGTHDRFHDQMIFPEIARGLPNGRFFFMKTDESKRERLQAVIAREFALVDKAHNPPLILRDFEINLERIS